MADQQERVREWVDCPQKCTGGRRMLLRPSLGPYEVVDLGPCLHCNGEGGWYLEEESDAF